jgi:hypothetical protein
MTSIAEGTFRSCTKLKNVSIPDTLDSIGNNAFSSCRSLNTINDPSNPNNINLPNSVTGIGDSAFSSCSGLISAVIPKVKMRWANP